MRKLVLLFMLVIFSSSAWAWNFSGWAPSPGFQQNGSNVTLIESNSNVGIGSTSPRGRLDVDGIIYVDAIYGDGSNLTGVSGISGLTTGYVPKASSSTAVADSAIYQNGTNIGVGTTVPQSRLMVDGGVYPTVDNVYDLGSASYSWKDLYVDGVAYIAQASVAGSNPSTFTGNYVAVGTEGTRTYADGIGDVYVQNDLEVDSKVYIGAPVVGWAGMGGAGDLAVAGDVEVDGALYVDGFLYGNGSKLTGIGSGLSGLTTDYIPVATSASTATDSIIYQTGNRIGISSVNPGGKLTVYTAENSAQSIRILNGSGSAASALFRANSDGAQITMGCYGTGYSGNGVAGQSQTDTCQIIGDNTTSPVNIQIGQSGNNPMYFGTNGAMRIAILGGGNIGIGSASPKAFLQVGQGTPLSVAIDGTSGDMHVKGDLEVDGALYVDGVIYAGKGVVTGAWH